MKATTAHWISTNSRTARLSGRPSQLAARLLSLADRLTAGRLPANVWVRYRLDLTQLQLDAHPPLAVLTPMDDCLMRELREHPWRNQPQLVTAFRFWQHGLRRAYVWLADGHPLCIQWLFTSEDNPRLRTLSGWAGMYPPLPKGYGQVENLLAFPRGLRYPGGAATPFAYGMYRLARELGLRQLITHVHEGNLAARRWAQRTGWVSYGTIYRHQLDFPLLRGRYVYVHTPILPHDERALATAAASPAPVAGIRPALRG